MPVERWNTAHGIASDRVSVAMPIGIAAATTAGRLHLALRKRLEQFDRSAAPAFTDLLVEQLEAPPRSRT